MEPFEWERIWRGADHSWSFLWEIAFRTLIMYVILFLFFRTTGKKELRQLSIFELILIVGLGSAAGDPMLDGAIPITHSLVIFSVILLLYMLVNFILRKSHKANDLLVGKALCVFCDNRVMLRALHSQDITTEDLFCELRRDRISQLGQVERVYLEFTGEFSIFLRTEAAVAPGLCIYPESLENAAASVASDGLYSCVSCGITQHYAPCAAAPPCRECGGTAYTPASDMKRTG